MLIITVPRIQSIRRLPLCVLVAGLIIAWSGAAGQHRSDTSGTSSSAPSDSAAPSTPVPAMPVYDVTGNATRIFAPRWPENEGRCYLYPGYIVIAWGSPDPEPVAIVRRRDPADSVGSVDCRPDSLPGDFVVRNEWAEYFCGMWGDLLFIDSGTGNVRSLILYDVPSRRQVFMIEGAGETAGWVDSTTVRIWVLCGGDFPRALCPDIPEQFGVGVDSLVALDLETLSMKALGPWRCNALQ